MAVEQIMEFSTELDELLTKKQDWYNGKALPALLEQFRLLYTCTKNLYDLLVSKSLIVPDAYRKDSKIAGIASPDTSAFNDSEAPMVIGTRFSEYEAMLDYICTYVRFTVDSLEMATIKKLLDFIGSFPWADYSPTSLKANIRGLALVLSQAKVNANQITISMISDSVEKCTESMNTIKAKLNELGKFQRELYKGRLRKDLFEHPNFDKEKAFASPDSEMVEIKKIFPLVMGKTPFYVELVNEIILEDQGPNGEALKKDLRDKLAVHDNVIKTSKGTKKNNATLLVESLDVLGALAPIYQAIYKKVTVNFGLMKKVDNGFMAKLKAFFKRVFKIKETEQIYSMLVTDSATHEKTSKVFNVTQITEKLEIKMNLYNDLAGKGPKYQSLVGGKPDQMVAFLDGEIRDCRSQFNLLGALETFFHNEVPLSEKKLIRGYKLELSTMRNAIINANSKKTEYQELLEEENQLKKLGLANEEE